MFLNFLKKTPEQQNSTMAMVLPWSNFFPSTFTGENEIGAYDDLGYIYDVDYYSLAKRAYTLVTVNEFARIAIARLAQFVIGTGLSLHPEPCKNFLKKKFNINISEEFSKDIKELWSLFEKDRNVSKNKEDTIHALANQIFINAFIAGDCLVIKRIIDKNLEYQIINGISVYSSQESYNNNKIKKGVELDKDGKTLAYWVLQE